jgi:hypothetical protein
MKRLSLVPLLILATTPLVARAQAHPTIAKAYKSTCMVSAKAAGGGTSRGTGVLLSSGYVLTAAHVVDANADGKLSRNEREVTLKFHSPKLLVMKGWVISLGDPTGKTHKIDLAIIIPEIHLVSKVTLAKQPVVGTPIFTIGHPMGAPPSVTDGRISHATPRTGRMTAPIFSGNSGGGVFLAGSQNCVGIVVRVSVFRNQIITHLAEYVRSAHIQRILKHVEAKSSPLEMLRFMQGLMRLKPAAKIKKIKKPKLPPRAKTKKPTHKPAKPKTKKSCQQCNKCELGKCDLRKQGRNPSGCKHPVCEKCWKALLDGLFTPKNKKPNKYW